LVNGHDDRNPAMAAEIGRLVTMSSPGSAAAIVGRGGPMTSGLRGMGRHRSLTEVDCVAATPYLAQ